MLNSELNRAKDEFKQQMKRSFELIQSINEAQPCFPPDQIYLAYEFCFLTCFLAWERFVENTFVLYMLGKKTDEGYGPKSYVKPVNREHAYDFVREGRDYADWTSPDIVIRKSTLFFENGDPYRGALGPVTSDIKDMKTIRNAIVHMSAESREKVRTLIRDKLVYARGGITVGEFLSAMLKGRNVTYITHYRELLELTSGRIVK
jgi:hypothetical protein